MVWAVYKNGNAITKINTITGTKTRVTDDDDFDLEFPESIDISIGDRCDGGCKFCYINASPNGTNGELLNRKFIDTLHPYTEIAVNGNSLNHPQLIPFLEAIKSKKVFANITVNQIHFERKEDVIRELVKRDLVKGIGISLRHATPEFVQRVRRYPNAVIHAINGIITPDDLEVLRDNNLKLLILGYKHLGRGVGYEAENDVAIRLRQRYLKDVLDTLPDHFFILSFDNLALEQLGVESIVSPDEWEELYMGDDGTSSMYIDLVTNKFGISSLCTPDQMHPLMDDVTAMFEIVKREAALRKAG